MRSTIEYTEAAEPLKFPQLMIGDTSEVIIIATSKQEDQLCGTIVATKDNGWFGVGDYFERWISANFKPFNGKVTLSN